MRIHVKKYRKRDKKTGRVSVVKAHWRVLPRKILKSAKTLTDQDALLDSLFKKGKIDKETYKASKEELARIRQKSSKNLALI